MQAVVDFLIHLSVDRADRQVVGNGRAIGARRLRIAGTVLLGGLAPALAASTAVLRSPVVTSHQPRLISGRR